MQCISAKNCMLKVKVKDCKYIFNRLFHSSSGIATVKGLLLKRGQNAKCHYLITNVCIMKRGKKMEGLLLASNNLQQAHLIYGIFKSKKQNLMA